MTTNKQFIFGIHSVKALMQVQSERIIRLYANQARNDKRLESLLVLAKKKNLPVELCSHEALNRMVSMASHQGIVVLCTKPPIYHENDIGVLLQRLTVPPFLLVLDSVQDPHNLGACFRSADAAGVHAIIVPKNKSVGLTPVVSKVASGAVEVIPFVQVTNLARTLQALRASGIWIYGAAAEAEQSLYQADLSGPIALVLGAESSGLRRLTRTCCDKLVKIPMQGMVSSLNISVAAGICLFEVVRQRASIA